MVLGLVLLKLQIAYSTKYVGNFSNSLLSLSFKETTVRPRKLRKVEYIDLSVVFKALIGHRTRDNSNLKILWEAGFLQPNLI